MRLDLQEQQYDTLVLFYRIMDNEGNLVNTNVANAIKYAVEVDGVKVLSISLGNYRGGTSEIAEVLRVAANYGTTVVAAAGNCSGITDESESFLYHIQHQTPLLYQLGQQTKR